MRGCEALLRAITVGSGPGRFRECFDFGGRDVASWFPGHMAKGEGCRERGGLAPPPLRCRRGRSPSAVLQACGRCGAPCGAPTASSRCTTLAYPPARLVLSRPAVSPGPVGNGSPGHCPLHRWGLHGPVCPSCPVSIQFASSPSPIPLSSSTTAPPAYHHHQLVHPCTCFYGIPFSSCTAAPSASRPEELVHPSTCFHAIPLSSSATAPSASPHTELVRPSTCVYASAQSLSLTVLTSHCRAVTPF